MAVNPFFKDSYSEYKLLDDLTIETIKAMGRDMIYLPRDQVKIDALFGEDTQSKFSSGYIIEMYMENIQEFGGQKDIITKFGLNINNRVTFRLSRTRFNQEITSKTSITYPREGDLIYIPLSNAIYEINFVEDEIPFYQFGKLNTFVLSCELFTYSNEEIDTGITEIDSVEEARKENATKLFLNLLSIGGITGATFTNAEIIYQVSGITGSTAAYSNATATATLLEGEYGTTYNAMYVTNKNGTFNYGSNMTVKGKDSGVEYYVTNVTTTNIEIPKDPKSEQSSQDNNTIDYQGNSIIDFTEKDPFSEGSY